MEILFWAVVVIVAHVYVGYPILLAAINRFGAVPNVVHGAGRPAVTLFVSAFNEEDVIAEKLTNSLSLGYASDRLQVVVISDASDDRTDEIVASFFSRGVELLRMPQRSGKTVGLNEAVKLARGDVLVFSDANAMYLPDALEKLVRNFADPKVGAVVGESTYSDPQAESERSEGLYWKYETAIKRLESRVGSVVGGDGAIYAIRRELYVPMRADALSDFVNPLQIVAKGYRCVYEPEARSVERAGGDFGKEFRRKVRIVNRAWRALFAMPRLLDPTRYGFFSFELLSHKVLRWLMPAFLVLLLVVNAVLLDRGVFYRATFVAQGLFYALALFGHALRETSRLPAFVTVPYYFCLVNLASALGIISAWRGQTFTTWSTARAHGNNA